MRNYLNYFIGILLFSCSSPKPSEVIFTVSDQIEPQELGLTLIHEHILVDFIGADSTGFHRWDKDSVAQVVLPYLEAVKAYGIKSIVECTPSFLGKDPILLKKLTEASGIQFITNTGYYGAVNGKYLPESTFKVSANELSSIWISEFQNGIEDTGIKPGFIKIAVNEGSVLSEMDAKLVKAAALTHKETGLLIVSHTGSWETAKAQIAILEQESASLDHFVWVHAQNEKNYSSYDEAYKKKVWISLDGIAWDVEGHMDRLIYCKERDFLDRVLVSHDAGWYSPGEPNGGDFKGFTVLFDELIPRLKEKGFTDQDFNMLLEENPKRALSLIR